MCLRRGARQEFTARNNRSAPVFTPPCGGTREERPRLLGLLGHEPWRQRRALAEEEVFHVLRDELLRFLLPRHQAVLVEDHLHSLLPHLPGVERDVLVDSLPQLTRPRRVLESGELLLELLAEHAAPVAVAAGRRRRRRAAWTHDLL